MTTRYVGAGGNDANTGLSWAQRKLTLNGVEDTPVAAGDIVYVAPGTYRELLTVDVSGDAGNVIQYIGDYDGSHTDGIGGVVRITGSNNDTTATRADCITITTKNYRSFSGFVFDLTTSYIINLSTSCTYITIDECYFAPPDAVTGAAIFADGATQSNIIISNCFFAPVRQSAYVQFTHTVTVSGSGHLISNCVFLQGHGSAAFYFTRVGGATIKNTVMIGGNLAVYITAALAVGQTITVNNCIIAHNMNGFYATAVGEITENYNSLWRNATARTNTNAGANSNVYPPLFDPRWFMQLVTAGAGPNSSAQVVSPYDLASYSQLINVAGTAPSATDLRGTAAIGGVREWGALEYDSTLKIEGGSGGAVSISPAKGNVG